MSSTVNFWNYTASSNNNSDFDSNLVKPEDVSVDAVVTSFFFNAIIFVFLMGFYECLRRLLPAVYSSKNRLIHMRPDRGQNGKKSKRLKEQLLQQEDEQPPLDENLAQPVDLKPRPSLLSKVNDSLWSLPDDKPLDWIGPVFGVPWTTVRKSAGLDGYFFLRFIRMQLRITAVTTFWFFLILIPLYYTGNMDGGSQSATGWYHISAGNIPSGSWRMWIPCIMSYFFTGFIIFVVKQEYRHYLELRQDFLAKGSIHVDPQHHYSMVVENIPFELRSDRALRDYFDKLFPGKVHSACVVLKVPDLEDASRRCTRSCRRLEKSIAYFHASGRRPTHISGRGRLSILGVDLAPMDLRCDGEQEPYVVDSDNFDQGVPAGVLVDSISYYTRELAGHSRTLYEIQQKKNQIAESGNQSMRADQWWFRQASAVASTIMDESILDNELIVPSESQDSKINRIPQAEHMASSYGSFFPAPPTSPGHSNATTKRNSERLGSPDGLCSDDSVTEFDVPFGRDQYRSFFRRWAGRLGLDFVVAIFKVLNKQLDVAFQGVLGLTMSSTGFVTFLDLSSTACAASAPLSVKASVLDVNMAPEPREILWNNAHVSKTTRVRRENVVNIVLFLGVILWSFPLTAIQVFAKAEVLAKIPGLEWIEHFHGGIFKSLINGYLPVIALLTLIMILPLLFESIAVMYEGRKTFTDVQGSMLTRYFYYQLANIYITVTAGSLFWSLADILDHPSKVLQILGRSLPTMAGYFIALLVTKIMIGLPTVFLRFGALSRMVFLKMLSSEKFLTQREVEAIYRLENVQYGWEFPTQLLVVVIVFTYAIICPIILPFGMAYFLGALVIYKKQVLYVYSPVYESGGALFPIAVQRSLVGLICGQLTFIGYMVVRGFYYQPTALVPLPILTVLAMQYLQKTYATPGERLSLERAREYDRVTAWRASGKMEPDGEETDHGVELRRKKFDDESYRQPILTEIATEPLPYRRARFDDETLRVRERLRHINRDAPQIYMGSDPKTTPSA